MNGAILSHHPVTREWITANGGDPDGELALITVDGICMEPTLRHGALIAIQGGVTTADLAAGGIFVFVRSGRHFVKRLRLEATRLIIVEDARPAEVKIVPRLEFERCYSCLHRVFWTGWEYDLGRSIGDLSPVREPLRMHG